jgi:hypothetical protein
MGGTTVGSETGSGGAGGGVPAVVVPGGGDGLATGATFFEHAPAVIAATTSATESIAVRLGVCLIFQPLVPNTPDVLSSAPTCPDGRFHAPMCRAASKLVRPPY